MAIPMTQPVGRRAAGNGKATPRARVTDDRRSEQPATTLATAVFVTGTAGLQPGRRYGIGLSGSRLVILGPTDLDPGAVALERSAGEIEVSSVEGRMILSANGSRPTFLLAFMSVAGAGPADVRQAIRTAAEGSDR
jgi:hypothetical protein